MQIGFALLTYKMLILYVIFWRHKDDQITNGHIAGNRARKKIKIINHITSFLDLDKQVEHPHQPQWKLFKEYYKISSCSK